jgi:N-methylhydantoinase A
VKAILAADIGGTFTDLVLRLPDGRLLAHKVLSTPRDYSEGVIAGSRELLESAGLEASEVEEVSHGTTLGTNAVLERKGALTALVTTSGFRDVLEIRRIRFPEPYNTQWVKPPPLVPRRLRFELAERIAADGSVLTAPDPAEIDSIAERLEAAGVTSVAVALINSYANPAHEELVGSRLANLLPGAAVTVSSRLLPEMGEYERTSTAVANAYLAPIMELYLGRLRQRLDGLELRGPLYVAQSNGGLFLHSFAMRKPYLTLESGPAAGCIAAQQLARDCAYEALLVMDMGGTTTKASWLAGGRVSWASEIEIGAPTSQASRLMDGGGYAVRCPIIDLAEVGAGGGSVAWLDSGGLLHVGPRSAGAEPGPACYGQGGEEPTLTDANVVLGYVNPRALAGGAFRIDPELARAAVGRLAEQLGGSVEETAFGIHLIANSNMTHAIRAVSTQRGRDLRDAAMLAFGGSGPLQAVGLAGSLGLRRVVVPPFPGLFSSLGLLLADVEHHLMRGFVAPLRSLDLQALNRVLMEMEDDVRSELDGPQLERMAALKLESRSGEILLDLAPGEVGRHHMDDLEERFREAYRAVYRHLPEDSGVELLNLRVVGRVKREEHPELIMSRAQAAPLEREAERTAYFGPDSGWLRARLAGRAELSTPMEGPLFVEEADSTTVVHPGWRARLDEFGNVVVER